MNVNIVESFTNRLANDTNIFFYSLEQENDVFVAKSHFFDFYFYPTYLEVVDSYFLPGPILQKYLQESLPFRIDFVVDNYYDILVEQMSLIQRSCIVCELRDIETED